MEINETETKKTVLEINESKSFLIFFEKIDKISKPWAKLTKKKSERRCNRKRILWTITHQNFRALEAADRFLET